MNHLHVYIFKVSLNVNKIILKIVLKIIISTNWLNPNRI
jgi:hypothetical protein